MRILIVEDHYKINQLITKFAKQENHRVQQCFNAEDALEAIKENNFDLIITDLMLPDIQGEELINRIRIISDVYIIVISAKNDLNDRIKVLNQGVDDYIVKPFSVNELMIKLKNIEKRLKSLTPLIHSYYNHELVIQPLTKKVLLYDNEIDLTAYEYDVLFYLSKHHNRVFSRDDLISALFDDSNAFDRVIDVYIKNIRKQLNDNPRKPKYIKTIYREGYQFIGKKDD